MEVGEEAHPYIGQGSLFIPLEMLRSFCGLYVSLMLAIPLARFYTRRSTSTWLERNRKSGSVGDSTGRWEIGQRSSIAWKM